MDIGALSRGGGTDKLPRTGFVRLDEARRRRSRHDTPLLRDPTEAPVPRQGFLRESQQRGPTSFLEIDDAYRVDSYVRQSCDKFTELITKQGWYLDAEDPEPIAYLKRRFKYMSVMVDKPFDLLLDELVGDLIKFGNAFWLKARGLLGEPIPGLPSQGVRAGQKPVLGYFRADPKRMKIAYSQDGKRRIGWEYTRPDGESRVYPFANVIHFTSNVQAGELFGSPQLQPALEDVRAYRQCEEYVLKLLYKHLHPLMQHEVPDVTDTGQGRQEDVDAAANSHSVIAPDGMIITPPGHRITMIGAESRAIRGEGYLTMVRNRVFAGLGVSSMVMGEGEQVSIGSADALTLSMHNKAKHYQRQLALQLEFYVLNELLLEGGFDPIEELDQVQWIWREIEVEAQIKRENHQLQLWTNGILTEDEIRQLLGRKPLTDEEYARTHIFRAKIPLVEAQAAARSQAANEGGNRQSASRDNPSNQHGARGAPKIRPR